MSLREERNEQNEQAWRAHFERERRDLSASVEAALMDDGVLAQQWLDEPAEQDASQPITGGTELIPPRLSLQSKMLPAVQPKSIAPAATASHQVISSHIVEETEEKPAPSSQPSGMLARLARRFTSSFAAVKPETPQQLAMLPSYAQSFSQDREAYHPARPANRQLSTPTMQPAAPLVRVIDTIIPFDPEEKRTGTEPGKRRSLKRNAKVRLETTEQPAIAKTVASSQREEQDTGEALLADVRNALSQQQVPPVLPTQRQAQSALHYGALRSATHSSLSGSGTFESEQSDVVIANSHITASSVVLVTLTTNPGPVVVQYISLQPEIGFTVHLTAPVTARTTFNYIILLGEMV